MGAPVVIPSKIPDKNFTLSVSCRGVVMLLCPGRLRSKACCICAVSICKPAGMPSIIPPMASPCDSPKVVRRKRVPKVLPAITRR